MLWSTRLLNVMLLGPVTAAAHHDETYCLTLMKVYRKWRYLHVCVGEMCCSLHRSRWTHTVAGTRSITAPPGCSSVFQPVTCRCISKRPCAPANGTKTKHFVWLIASVCTSRPKWVSRDQRGNRTCLRRSVNGKEVLVSKSWKLSLKASNANHMKRMIKGCIHTEKLLA